MLPEWCAKLVWATHTKSPQSCCIPHPAHVGSSGWEGKLGGAAALASPAWARASIAVAGAPEAVRGAEPGPSAGGLPSPPQSQPEALKMAELNRLSVAFLIVGRGLLLESGGGAGKKFVCLTKPEKEDVSGKRKKKG